MTAAGADPGSLTDRPVSVTGTRRVGAGTAALAERLGVAGLALLHGDGPGARWAGAARPGDELEAVGPRGIDLGYSTVRATRITCVGELGWEPWVPSELTAAHRFATVAPAGRSTAPAPPTGNRRAPASSPSRTRRS